MTFQEYESLNKEQEIYLPKNIYFVRHGQTTANVNGQLDKNPQLTALGASQALEVGVVLEQIHPVAIIHTGLDRTRETAQLLAIGGNLDLPLVEMREFREREMGIYDGTGSLEALREQPGMEELFEKYGGSFVWFAGGNAEDHVEQLQDMRQRLIDGLRLIQKRYGSSPVIVVAHEGSIKMTELIYQGINQEMELKLATRRIGNCEVLNMQER